MDDTIKTILRESVHAPSGDNSQPWHFKVSTTTVQVWNVPSKESLIFNAHQQSSLVSCGALIETICLRASSYGYETSVDLFPGSKEENYVALITFTASQIKEDDLSPYVLERVTNRYAYTGDSVPKQDQQFITEVVRSAQLKSTIWTDSQEQINQLAVTLTVYEMLLFGNKKLHANFFRKVFFWWKLRNYGLHIATLGLTWYEQLGMALLRFWPIIKVCSFFYSVSDFVSVTVQRKYKTSGNFVAFTGDYGTKESKVALGRDIQRFWLAATKYGYVLQPCDGVIYLSHAHNTEPFVFSNEERTKLLDAYSMIQQTFNTDEKIGFIFRIGKSVKQAVRSPRQSLKIDRIH
jgi:hypothetical protein